jgi:hypothetical protein
VDHLAMTGGRSKGKRVPPAASQHTFDALEWPPKIVCASNICFTAYTDFTLMCGSLQKPKNRGKKLSGVQKKARRGTLSAP